MSTELNKTEENTFEKCMLYMYLVAAYADYQIQEEEIELIKEKLNNYNLISPEAFDSTFHHVLREFQSHNDFESMQYIEKMCKELNIDDTAKHKIYHDFQEIIMADGKKDDDERINMFKFRKILGLEPEA